ncbi:MAG: hypothetical protein KC910_20900, partial [Candidatus Eremiobacteraeota bacterium]|nr:hypothetical protein [Candidatus Eremiobacteraeota bacterium]
IWYVAHGVVVAEETLPHPIGLNAVVSAAGLDTDLSGLKLVDNVKKERLQSYLERVLERALDQLLAIEPHPPKKLTKKLLARLPERAARLAQLEKRRTTEKKPRKKAPSKGSTYAPTAAFGDDYKTMRRQQRERGL